MSEDRDQVVVQQQDTNEPKTPAKQKEPPGCNVLGTPRPTARYNAEQSRFA
jgi:hypothetical protein